MAFVTYLLGAGASAGCIPVVNDMSQSLMSTHKLFGEFFSKPILSNQRDPDVRQLLLNHNKKVEEIQIEISQLAKICESHYSIDTYAKKLYIKRDDNAFRRLKNILSLYFTIQQVLYPPDKRYDNFWASILNRQNDFPQKLRIVSWNYDSQLEIAYKNFTNTISLDEVYQKTHTISFHDDHRRIEEDQFAVFKLNGSAKYIRKEQDRSYTNFLLKDFPLLNKENSTESDQLFSRLSQVRDRFEINNMLTADENINTAISFAWEHEINNGYYTKLRNSLKATQILVVIGYSFPFFNREIDKLILNDFMPKLTKVYFQAPDAENLQERFMALTDKECAYVLARDKNQFIFPNELEI